MNRGPAAPALATVVEEPPSQVTLLSPRRIWVDLGLAVFVGGLAFGYRYLSHSGFMNDQFVHLICAQAMLLGDLPIRDYTEVGWPLTVALSAASQILVGPGPLAELILVLAVFAAAAAVTCWVSIRLTGSRTLGLLAAILQILAAPRLYSHPKIFVYPVFLLIAIWYTRRPGLRRVTLVAAWTAVAFLFRHDHGVFVAIGATTTLLLTHWRDGSAITARRIFQYAMVVLLCLIPYLAYVQWQLGITPYFRRGIVYSQAEAARAEGWPHFDAWKAGPLLIRLPADPMDLPSIHIRWRPTVTDDLRARYERQFALYIPTPHDGPRTWRYHVDPDAAEALARLVALPDVEDVSGFNRTTRTLTNEPGFLTRIVQRNRVNRIRFGPVITSAVSESNATALLFWLVRLLPLVAWLAWWFGGRRLTQSEPGPAVAALCVLTLVCGIGLAREPSIDRVADTFGTLPILAMWSAAAAWELRSASGIGRVVSSTIIVLAVAVLVSAVWLRGGASEVVAHTGIAHGLDGLAANARKVSLEAKNWPWPREWPGADDWQVARYVHDCTRPEERLLVTWIAPEFNFFSQRAFAGGESQLFPASRLSDVFELRVLRRWPKQSVPIVLAEVDEQAAFVKAYPRLAAYLDARYQRSGEVDFGKGHHIIVYVDRLKVPTRVDPTFGFPCFA